MLIGLNKKSVIEDENDPKPSTSRLNHSSERIKEKKRKISSDETGKPAKIGGIALLEKLRQVSKSSVS